MIDYTPGARRGMDVELATVEGEGFVAGVADGYVQRDKSAMVFHTEGMTILLDGETAPHAIQGHNVEDDFNLTWGFNDFQSPWFGCPWHAHRDWNHQDGMYYRFFGPDAIAFESSLVFRMGARGDDTESVVYYYRIPRTNSPKVLAPKERPQELAPAVNQ